MYSTADLSFGILRGKLLNSSLQRVPFTSSGISILLAFSVPVDVIYLSRSQLAGGMLVHNLPVEILRPCKLKSSSTSSHEIFYIICCIHIIRSITLFWFSRVRPCFVCKKTRKSLRDFRRNPYLCRLLG